MKHATFDKRAGSKHTSKFSTYDFFLLRRFAWGFAITLAHLLAQGRLHLINTSNLVPLGNELICPMTQAHFRHPNHTHVDTVSKLEIKELVTDGCIVFIKLIEFALLEENDGVPELLLDLPILLLKWREL